MSRSAWRSRRACPHGGRLLLNGVEVAPSSSLASYGVRAGAVLELVPHETGPPAALPSGSPLLSSPQHELVRCILSHTNIYYVEQKNTIQQSFLASACASHS